MKNRNTWVNFNPASSEAELRLALLNLAISLLLVTVKFAAYFITLSQAVYSDAMESIANVVGAGFALYAIRTAHRPADQDHPYGHGKVEFFSAGLEGAMIILAAVLIFVQVLSSFTYHNTGVLHSLDVGLILVAFGIFVNGGLGFTLFRRGKKTSAMSIEASGVHLMIDAIDSVAVLVGLLIVRITGLKWIDSLVALMVACYIVWHGLRLLKRSAAGLMDQQDVHDTLLLRQILEGHMGPEGKEPRICGFHKLRHRHSGRYHWVDFHIEVPASWSIAESHRVASVIEYEIELALKEGNATAHIEPCADADCPRCAADRQQATEHADQRS
jgi:cation diffusion facilitator family transporter